MVVAGRNDPDGATDDDAAAVGATDDDAAAVGATAFDGADGTAVAGGWDVQPMSNTPNRNATFARVAERLSKLFPSGEADGVVSVTRTRSIA
jgi:hypothetical protein